MNLLSPITGMPAAKFNILDPKRIIQCYQQYLGLDVSHYFNNIDKVVIGQCLQTGLLFYYPNNIDGDDIFYGDLVDKMLSRYGLSYYSTEKWEYDIAIKYLKHGESIYEIGAGSGNFLKKLQENGFQNIQGSEFSLNAIKLAAEKGISLEQVSIEEKAKIKPCSVDTVVSFQVLEHIANPYTFLNGCVELIKPGGKLIFAVPYNHPYLFGNDIYNTLNMPPHHMGLWNKEAFENLTKVFPISVADIIIERLPNSGYDFDQYYAINKDENYSANFPFKKLYDKLYFKYLKKYHHTKAGKNIIAVYSKNLPPDYAHLTL